IAGIAEASGHNFVSRRSSIFLLYLIQCAHRVALQPDEGARHGDEQGVAKFLTHLFATAPRRFTLAFIPVSCCTRNILTTTQYPLINPCSRRIGTRACTCRGWSKLCSL